MENSRLNAVTGDTSLKFCN